VRPEHGEGPPLLFYVMPFVEGESLRARLEREKQLPVDEALRITVAVASALDYAHQHGVIHRDLKPENILLQAGQPVVSDFGIALAVSNAGGTRVTQTGLSLGTPQYMSPEQATGDRVIDGRSDIYSLAAVAYEMLTGEPPHTGSTAQAIIARVLTEHPRHVRATRPNVPEHVEMALERGLEKLPADRWATAAQFAEAMQGRATSAPARGATVASPASGIVAPSAWRANLRNPVVLALMLVSIGALAVALRGPHMPPQSDGAGSVRFALPMPTTMFIGALTGSTVAISPDGRLAAFVGTNSGTTQLYLRPLDELRSRALDGTVGAQEPFFSPDGKWIGFWSGGKIQKVAVDGGSVFPLADLPLGGGATWSPSGEIIAQLGATLVAIPSAGGTPVRLAPLDRASGELVQQWPLALPDGEHVLYSSINSGALAKAHIAVLSLKTRKATILDVQGVFPLGVVDGFLVFAASSQALLAVPFDVRASRTLGSPVPVASDVLVGAGGAAKAALSSSGTLIFQSGSQASQAVLVDMHGGVKLLLPEARPYGYPRFSPDGKRVAVTIGTGPRTDVWIYDIAAGVPTRLTSEGTSNERPEWTPDGKRVLYRSDRGRRSALWWQAADESGSAAPLLASANGDIYEGVMTPDGKTVVYQLDTAGADVLFRSIEGDTTPRRVAESAAIEDMARVSPDGKWVAFVTDASGSAQVVVQPFPGPGGRIQVSSAGGFEPVWSRDGRRLFYRDGSHLVAATVVTSPGFTVTSRTPLFDDTFAPAVSPHANYDVAPDGEHLLLLRATESSQVIIVHNWRAEMHARLAGRTSK
ncbi:MAG: protein kinase, partial [Gemmatimonadales bacterium]